MNQTPESKAPQLSPIQMAVNAVRNGQCEVCKKTRIAKTTSEGGTGFGSTPRQKTIYVCGTTGCNNFGNE